MAMTDYDLQLKVQARLDGELSPRQARRLDAQLAQDPEAQALLAELQATTAALAAAGQDLKLPEDPQFFWSKIEREIQRQPLAVPSPWRASWLAKWRWALPPAAALAGLVAYLALRPVGGPEMETALADTGAFTYHDFAAGTTLVWFSYPAEEEPADEETPGEDAEFLD
jgi:anti-sigma factor RsiW